MVIRMVVEQVEQHYRVKNLGKKSKTKVVIRGEKKFFSVYRSTYWYQGTPTDCQQSSGGIVQRVSTEGNPRYGPLSPAPSNHSCKEENHLQLLPAPTTAESARFSLSFE